MRFRAAAAGAEVCVTARADLKSTDGQTLGYTWLGIAETWHRSAFTSFGDGHGVWKKTRRVLRSTRATSATFTQWAAPVQTTDLMPTLVRLQKNHFNEAPSARGRAGGSGDVRIASSRTGSTWRPRWKPNGTGLVWTAVREGEPIPRAHPLRRQRRRAHAARRSSR